jgi:hypothetical protein
MAVRSDPSGEYTLLSLSSGYGRWRAPASMQDSPEFLPPASGCKVAGEHDICFEKLTSTSPAADNCR